MPAQSQPPIGCRIQLLRIVPWQNVLVGSSKSTGDTPQIGPTVNYYDELGANTPVMARTITIRKKETPCQDLRNSRCRTGDSSFGP